MSTIYLVTGNKGKLAEWQRLMPPDMELESVDIDLDEIQSLDLEAIALDKAKRAYAVLGKPVLVEDVAASIDALNGLPGPFIKYFEQALGNNALYTASKGLDPATTVTCTIAFCDENGAFAVSGSVHGTAVESRGKYGFGFDACFLPDGQTKTYGEMDATEKDAISHRSLAIKELAKQFQH